MPKGDLKKISVVLNGHATSVAIEPQFWNVLEGMGKTTGLSRAAVLAKLDEGRGDRPLASVCRLAALEYALARRK